jgi:hypothetical protein
MNESGSWRTNKFEEVDFSSGVYRNATDGALASHRPSVFLGASSKGHRRGSRSMPSGYGG